MVDGSATTEKSYQPTASMDTGADGLPGVRVLLSNLIDYSYIEYMYKCMHYKDTCMHYKDTCISNIYQYDQITIRFQMSKSIKQTQSVDKVHYNTHV